jgi:hypothetical protein
MPDDGLFLRCIWLVSFMWSHMAFADLEMVAGGYNHTLHLDFHLLAEARAIRCSSLPSTRPIFPVIVN